MVNGLVGIKETGKKPKDEGHLEPANIEIATVRDSSRTLALATPQLEQKDKTQ